MTRPSLDDVRAALAQIRDPVTGLDVVSSGLLRGLTLREGRVGFVIEAPPARAGGLEPLRAAAEAAARAVPGVVHVTAVLTAHAEAPAPPPAPRGRARLAPQLVADAAPKARRPSEAIALPGVATVLAVASGKGGVGKSTVAANLACAFARAGKRTGLLDADVYGPSIPILMGLQGALAQARGDGSFAPPEAYGVKVMSMGFLVDPCQPMIWRGPMLSGALVQMLSKTAWAPLDMLVIDLPPGTGDTQLTLCQRAPLSGAVIVCTPQELALADARRGAEMFRRMGVGVLGFVENMSAFIDPATGVRLAPFGEGGGRRAAEALGVPFLGALPLDPALAAASDAGAPPAAAAPESPMGATFAALAGALLAQLAAGAAV